MKPILFSVFLILIFFQFSKSQTVLKGKIVSELADFGEIYITNLTTNAKTIVANDGLFSIEAKPNQILVFSGIKTERKAINLKPTDFTTYYLTLTLYPKINMLAEVEIKNYPSINAISLGIISKNVKTYTPAERRLISGSSGIGIVQLLNTINGRTDELKKNVEVEKKIKLLSDISNLYNEAFYVETLKVPSNYIKGFQLFMIDDKKIVDSLNNKNITLTTFLLTQLALNFNKIVQK